MDRPVGVTVIAVLLVLVGAVSVIQGITTMRDLSAGWGAVQLVTGAAAIACGVGCWMLRSWARVTTIVLMALNAMSLIGIWAQFSHRIIVSRVVIPLVVNIIVVLYLLGSRAAAAFGKPRA